MEIMILSDSHSMKKNELMELLNHQKVDCYIHCGDIFMPYEPLNLPHFHIVKGNNDFLIPDNELTLEIDGLKFYIVHGHRYEIDHGIALLKDYAKENHIDVVCFGHSHRPTCIRQEKTIYINPGSVTYPRGQYRYPTYCIFNTETKAVTYYNAKDHTVCDPFSQPAKHKKSRFHLFKKKR